MVRHVTRWLLPLLFCAGCAPRGGGQDEAVLRIGDEFFTRAHMNQIEELFRHSVTSAHPQASLFGGGALVRKNAAREVVAGRLMVREAGVRGLQVSAHDVEAAYTGFRERLGPVQLKKEIAASGRTEESFRQYLAEGMLVDSLMKLLLEQADTVSEEACREFYDSNRDHFTRAGQVRVSHIFFPVTGDDDAAPVVDTARAVLARLKGGEDFAGLARSYSRGPAAADGGDMGWFSKGDILPEVEAAAFALKDGQISDLVLSQAGVHIVRKTGERGEQLSLYDEVRDDVRARLEIAQRMRVIGGFVDSLMRVGDVEYLDTTYLPPPGREGVLLPEP